MQVEKFYYDNKIVKAFGYATVIFGIVGMLAGLWAAIQLYAPAASLHLAPTTFGRMRPLHTNAIIFAFVGNTIFMGVYYSLQRLCKTRMYSDTLSWIHFWGWQLIIAAAAVTLLMGYTTGKEYAELEWPIDIAITLVWVVFGINMFGTIIKRREKHLYVAIWFYIGTWVTVAMLHIVNSIEIPVTFFKSYSWYAGVQDALVQWWYGHNAVAFFLTTPILGLMYYFLPKAANRPIYSYRLSIKNAPVKYNVPPTLRAIYIGTILVTVSKNWNFNWPSGVKFFHIRLCVNPAQYKGTAYRMIPMVPNQK